MFQQLAPPERSTKATSPVVMLCVLTKVRQLCWQIFVNTLDAYQKNSNPGNALDTNMFLCVSSKSRVKSPHFPKRGDKIGEEDQFNWCS
jgi:hypothetical protein